MFEQVAVKGGYEPTYQCRIVRECLLSCSKLVLHLAVQIGGSLQAQRRKDA
ncbi:hypothetical protein Z948_2390 [Sulfitobacter donghicola DSW-25 = KCTC 12864 = JCM 14565]|uniref:Uncharacterized protein n=1 Tax=Sulfitobacter donghicola DSW-25 = KCTC 12864 = JCM 14565 TaxID=1300350 RepID=A0A073IGG5_9RHOB|nr:hypothetical protein DSW25_14550 [Sulfitobacter donghicola DSW-25 = KCTC 12864 = JCM 14565]KIN68659.1 hypothetical protein Z948_2390 [Sulfitobacter donghicola DSW-25 = KCTC 12864 = JCM 14565]